MLLKTGKYIANSKPGAIAARGPVGPWTHGPVDPWARGFVL